MAAPSAFSPRRRLALVTGSGNPTGIGFEVARQLASNPHSYIVLLSARNPADAEAGATALRAKLKEESAGLGAEEIENRVAAIALDVSDPSSIRAAVDTVEKDFGKLDVLVNNAGLALPKRRFEELAAAERRPTTETASMDDAQEVFLANVSGVIQISNAFLPLLSKSDLPRIVNVSSARGSLTLQSQIPNARAGIMIYNASKAALNMVTVMQAKAFPEHNPKFKVNAASPGHVSTSFNRFTGHRTVSEGAGVVVWLATLPDASSSEEDDDDDAPPQAVVAISDGGTVGPVRAPRSPNGGLWGDHEAQAQGRGLGCWEKVPW